jgi:hypothetical protein
VVDFGQVVVGLVGRRVILLENPSREVLRVRSVRASDGLAGDIRLDGVPAALSAGSRVEVEAVFGPSSPGTRSGTLMLETEGSEAKVQSNAIEVSAIAVEPSLAAIPSVLDFGRVPIGGSATGTVTLENRGTSDVTITAITPDRDTAEFSVDPTPITTLHPGDSAPIFVRFAPVSPGLALGRIVISDDTVRPRPLGVDVAGEGIEGSLLVEPPALAFTNVFAGETRARRVVIQNAGTSTHTLVSIGVLSPGGSFSSSVSFDLPALLGPGREVSLAVVYRPRVAGSEDAVLRIESTAPVGIAAVPISGSAILPPRPRLRPSPERLDFGGVEIGSPGERLLTLTSTGTALVSVFDVRIEPETAPFVLLGPDVPAALEATELHVLAVGFAPAGGGSFTASLIIESDDGTDPIRSIELSGRGEIVASPDLDVRPGEVQVGMIPRGIAAVRAVELRNGGTAPLDVTDVRLLEDAAGRYTLVPPVAFALAPGERRDVLVELFDPLGLEGARLGLVEIRSDDPDRIRVEVPLEGATAPTLDAAAQDAQVRLAWTGDANLDLHVIRPGGTLFDAPADCCFCSPNPRWNGSRAEDPFLDADHRTGGPETIVIRTAPEGLASVEVHHRGPGGDVAVATVEVWIRGSSAGVSSRAVAPLERWRVGWIESAGGGLQFRLDLETLVDTPSMDRCF